MREYETTVIIQPEISDEGSQAIREKLDGSLEKYGAVRLLWSDLGKRKLAYEIRKFHKGHYYVLHYLDQGRVIPELERLMRIDESVLRFMTVRVSDRVTDIEARKAEAREIPIITTDSETKDIVASLEDNLMGTRLNQEKKLARLADVVKQNLDINAVV